MSELNEAYKELLVKFDENREWLISSNRGLCGLLQLLRHGFIRSHLGRNRWLLLKQDCMEQGIPSTCLKWSFTKRGYDARRRWIQKRIKETQG